MKRPVTASTIEVLEMLDGIVTRAQIHRWHRYGYVKSRCHRYKTRHRWTVDDVLRLRALGYLSQLAALNPQAALAVRGATRDQLVTELVFPFDDRVDVSVDLVLDPPVEGPLVGWLTPHLSNNLTRQAA